MSEEVGQKIKKKKRRLPKALNQTDIDFPGADKTISIKLFDQPEKFFRTPASAYDYYIRMRPPKRKKKLNVVEKKSLKKEFDTKGFVSYRKEDGEVNPDE